MSLMDATDQGLIHRRMHCINRDELLNALNVPRHRQKDKHSIVFDRLFR